MKAKILFVEDDMSLALVTKDSLELNDYEIVHCENGADAWHRYNQEDFDLCLLDVMLPKLDGFQLAEKIRASDSNIPILILTAKSLQEDKITGLRLGGDDYITKPFSIEELMLKIDIFLRRSNLNENSSEAEAVQFTIGQFEFDFENLSLRAAEQQRQLTLREAEVLRYFCQRVNQVIRREEILEAIWGKNDYFMGRSLDVFITRLRKYLKADSAIKIENIPSVGFRMKIQQGA